jgi:hypothetical protein
MSKPDSEDRDETEESEVEESEESESEESEESKSEAEEAKKVEAKPARQKARRGTQARPAAAAAGQPVPMSRVVLFVVAALAAGGAGGWFGHDAQAKAKVRADSAAAPAGSGAAAGPCGAWQKQVCDSGGENSALCAQAKGALELLTPSTCESALATMPATIAKLKAARKSCDSLVSKLCKDLPPNSQACEMVKEKTPAFPSQRCDEMLKHYDEVLGSLKELEAQGGMQMGGPGGMRPPGGAPMAAPGMQRPVGAVPGH